MKWCAEGDVPTAANLNLYWRWKSLVGWHCDDGPLFGRCGVEKLIVSVSFGRHPGALQMEASPVQTVKLDRASLAMILVMDGQCQDEFLHCTDPGLEQERINVTFRWIRQHVASLSIADKGSMLFANVYAGFSCLLVEFFCLVGTLLFGGGSRFSGIFGLDGLSILARPPDIWLLRFSTREVAHSW